MLGKASAAIGVLLVVALVLVDSPAVRASPPTVATGNIVIEGFAFTSVRSADGNTILQATEADGYTGTFAGSSTDTVKGVFHSDGSGVIETLATFTGTVDGREGTFVLHYAFTVEEGPLFAPRPIHGEWVIMDGTGDLAALHGRGTAEGLVGVGGTYSGEIHFDP